jgi:hypothetical protein
MSDFLDQVAGEGLDVFSSNDLSIPFIKIAQKTSHEVEEQHPDYIKDLKPGMFFNSLTKRIYGASLKVIPLYYEPSWLIFGPNRGGFKGKAAPNSIQVFGSPYDEGGMKDKDGNDVTDVMVYYVIVVDEMNQGPAVLTFKSTDLKHARNWDTFIANTVLPSGKRAPFFGGVWELTLTYNQNESGSWFGIGGGTTTTVKKERLIVEEEYLSFVKPNRDMILAGKKTADFSKALEGPGSRVQISGPAGSASDPVPY